MRRVRHGKQSCRIHKAQVQVNGCFAEQAAVLRRGVICPKKGNLCLLWRPHCTVCRSQRFHLVIVISPFSAKEIGRRFGKKLCCIIKSARHHLSDPRCLRGCCGRSQDPNAGNWSRRVTVGHVGSSPIACPQGDQGVCRSQAQCLPV